MAIFRSTDPAVWDDVDGIIINESAPAPNVQGVAANIAILIGQAQRGPAALTEVGSIGEFFEIYGKDDSRGINLALKNKKFGRLKIARVIAAAGVVASKAFQSTATDRITFTAKQGKGAYGNGITVTIANGTVSGKKYTIQDTNPGAVLPIEVYDNAVITVITPATFANSNLITAVINSTAAEPTNVAATPLATGADGTPSDAEYQTAIALCEVEAAGNILFLDAYNATRNGYLLAHAAAMQDKMVICAGAAVGDSVATSITAVGSLRDVDGRVIYAYPFVQTSINGVLTMTNPASWMASIISQIGPNVDPAYVANAQLLTGITGLELSLTRNQFIQLKDAGIAAFEFDSDIGYKVKSGIVTQISDSSKLTILRRRMADYLTVSVAKFLKNYQNAPNSKSNRSLVKGAMLAFVQSQENAGILPKDSDLKTGKAKLIDTESLNTDASVAAGFFKILWRQRIFSSMRYIVLQAEIGESVVVTDQS